MRSSHGSAPVLCSPWWPERSIPETPADTRLDRPANRYADLLFEVVTLGAAAVEAAL